jgi:hypothetical protein
MVLDPTIEVVLLRLLRAELSFQFRSHALNIETLSFVGDSCSGLKFFEPTTKCLEFISMALLDLGCAFGQFGLETSPCVVVVVGVLLLDEPKGFFGA